MLRPWLGVRGGGSVGRRRSQQGSAQKKPARQACHIRKGSTWEVTTVEKGSGGEVFEGGLLELGEARLAGLARVGVGARFLSGGVEVLSLIHISEPTRRS
eukprot:6290392-Prymnesium_polylepis.1